MGITFETPEEKKEIISNIKKEYAEKHGIADVENNPILDELAKTEFNRRETQASYTKARQDLTATQAEKDFLLVETQKGLNLSAIQNEELEKLKFNDPDRWKDTVTKLESQAKSDFDKTITDGLGHARSEASKNYELSRREEILKDFSLANPDFNLTDEVVREQLPPRLVNQLANGELAFGDFLTKAQIFITSPKKTDTKTPDSGSKTLDNLQGKGEPDRNAVNKEIADQYENLTL